jgi:hypothetical protein
MTVMKGDAAYKQLQALWNSCKRNPDGVKAVVDKF